MEILNQDSSQSDSKKRIAALKKILADGFANTQDEIVEELHKLNFDITQSTISRDLRRLGAMRIVNSEGETVYKLPTQINNQSISVTASVSGGLSGLIKDIKHNGYVIVIHTIPGSASLIARHIDDMKMQETLGTIAGDDTIFVIPSAFGQADQTIQALKNSFEKMI